MVNYQENKAVYQEISDKTGFPPELIALLHYREAGTHLGTEEYFNIYLHNGEQLGHPTQKKPSGKLFYDFDTAAIDALRGDYFVSLKKPLNISGSTKDIAALVTFAELYNGTGYFDNGYANPYLYSGTNIYDKGKYVEVYNGKKYESQYDPDLVDEQVGVSILLAIILG